MKQYDVLIIGGGMTGASMALMLSGHGLSIAVCEASQSHHKNSQYDQRAIVLSYSSRQIFEAMGVWEKLLPLSQPITNIHVSDKGRFGFTRLSAKQSKVDAMGYVCSAGEIGEVLSDQLKEQSDIDYLCAVNVERVESVGNEVVVYQSDDVNEKFSAQLVIAADGKSSKIRQQLKIPVSHWKYQQIAFVTFITPEIDHQGVAYERFTEKGPVVLLPMKDGQYAVVWTVNEDEAESIKQLSDEHFIETLQKRFGRRVGKFHSLRNRLSYPLDFIYAEQLIKQRVALIGNAAHAFHPIAGQGFNLGLRDVVVLAEQIIQANNASEDIGAESILKNYESLRKSDHQKTLLMTEGFVRIFNNPLFLIGAIRNIGMSCLDLFPSLKQQFIDRSMGVSGSQSKILAGLSVRD